MRRCAVIEGSSCRTVPAVKLRGFAKVASPCFSRSSFSLRKPRCGISISPRTSKSAGMPAFFNLSFEIASGIERTVRTFSVTSSPTLPSPRVMPRSRRRADASVDERERHAIELQFAHVFEVGAAAQFMHAPLPVAQLFFAVGVVEREHGRRMLRLDESFARLAADALRWRIGRDQLGMLRLKPLQLIHQLVEFGVGEFGIVEDVIDDTRGAGSSRAGIRFFSRRQAGT